VTHSPNASQRTIKAKEKKKKGKKGSKFKA
jgi:hypothetical protein